MRRVFIADHFHNLPGFVEERHSHDWIAEATFIVSNKEDACASAKMFNAWVEEVQFSLLNNQERLKGRNPTAEVLAQWLFEFLEYCSSKVVRVKMQEKENYWAAYGRRII